jgi:hypothetical protein
VGNALAITLYCLDHAYASRGRDFLAFAFEQFPDTDYLLLTLPSTCTPPPLLSSFTLVRPKPASTLSHVLYILHRDTLLATSHLRYAPVAIPKSNPNTYKPFSLREAKDPNQSYA